MAPRFYTDQPQPQGQQLVSLAGGFDVLHQPADRFDALLVGLGWLADAGCFGHGESVAPSRSGSAMAITFPLGGR